MKKKIKTPFIGITCDIHIPPKRKFSYYELVCDHRYAEAVKQAGGYPVLLPIASREDIIRKYLDEIDGIVIVGGDDVDPKLYGEKKKKGTGTVFLPRLRFEKRLYREARKRELPILGICYGMQLINVLEGGTLFQDIKRDAKSRLNHRNMKHPNHRIRLEPSSRMGRILGKTHIRVHCEHHQAVSRVAPKFLPVAFSTDGIIEAIESESEKILAVQWHPERIIESRETKKLFRTFIRISAGGRWYGSKF